MRLFLAINLPEKIKLSLKEELPRFQHLKFREISEANWHVTVKFIGEVDEAKIRLIREALQPTAAQFKPFCLTIRDVGFLNRRIFAFNVERSQKLFALFRTIDDRLAARRVCKPERFRTFTGHITVGRKNPPITRDLHSVRHFDLKSRVSLNFLVLSVDLMKSELKEGGSDYAIIEQYPLLHAVQAEIKKG